MSENRLLSEGYVNDIRASVGYFEPDPYLVLGESDSMHGVMFGVMPELGQVAIKPFQRLGKAQAEEHNLRNVAERGFDALEPITVASGGLASYLITERRKGLRHLGQMDWSTDVASKRLSNVLVPALGVAAQTAADWHSAKITHGDMQIKNMAYDVHGNSVYIDAEKTAIGTSLPSHLTQLAHKDLGMLTSSVLHSSRGFLHDKSPSYRVGVVTESFIDPYLDAAKPEQFALSPEVRRKAIVDWLTAYVNTRGSMPTFTISGLEAPRARPKAAA